MIKPRRAKLKRPVKGPAVTRMDPTRTLALRTRFCAKLKRKFALLKGRILKRFAEASVLALNRNGDVLDLSDVRQTNDWSCGAAAAMCVGKYLGVGSGRLSDWIDALGSDEKDGTDPFRIAKYLNALGLEAVPREDMTVADLEKATGAGHPVIVCVQDYGRSDSYSNGHYLVVAGVAGGLVLCQDPSLRNVMREPGGDVRGGERSGSIGKPGLVPIDEDKFLGAWHDVASDGRKLVRFGITVSAPVANFNPNHGEHGHFASAGSLLAGAFDAGKAALTGTVKAVYDASPRWLQKTFDAAKHVEHALEGAYAHGRQFAEALAQERGLNAAHVERVSRVLGAVDGVMRWTANIPLAHQALDVLAGLGGPVAMIGAKVGWYLPTASLAYIGYSLGRHLASGRDPVSLIKGARERVRYQSALRSMAARNAFCPTGEGGGVDPSCSPGMRVEGRNATPRHRRLVQEAVDALPSGVHRLLSGVKVVAVERLRSEAGVIGLDYGGEWKNGEVRVTEHFGGDAKEHTRETLRHEVGHAVDEKLSRSGKAYSLESLRDEYNADVSTMPKRLTKELGSFIRTGDAGPTEAFAQSFATHTGETVSVKSGSFVKGFPRVHAAVMVLLQERGLVANLTRNDAADEVDEFQAWLELQYKDLGLLDEDLWTEYAARGFQRGAGRAFDDAAKFSQESPDFYRGSREQFLKDSFGRPASVEKMKLLASRSFDEMEGVTSEMSRRISRELVDGLVEGKGADSIADDLVTEVGFSEQRALTVARTEIIRCHAEGQLQALEDLGVAEVGVDVEWSTAEDGKVCELCDALSGVVLKVDEAHNLIPRHPNCRCSFIPANVGEDTSDQKRGEEAEEALEEGGLGEEADSEEPEEVLNTFCATGVGGGVDPTCGPGQKSMTVQRAIMGRKFHNSIQMAADLSDEHRRTYTEAIDRVLDAMPDAALKRLELGFRSAVWYRDTNDLGKAYYKAIGSVKDHGRVNGFFTPSTGKVHLNGLTDKNSAPGLGDTRNIHGTYAHELGHAIDGHGFHYSDSSAWKAAHGSEILGEVRLSKYAQQSRQEGFAEFSRLLYGSNVPREHAEAKFPKCFAFFRERGLV